MTEDKPTTEQTAAEAEKAQKEAAEKAAIEAKAAEARAAEKAKHQDGFKGLTGMKKEPEVVDYASLTPEQQKAQYGSLPTRSDRTLADRDKNVYPRFSKQLADNPELKNKIEAANKAGMVVEMKDDNGVNFSFMPTKEDVEKAQAKQKEAQKEEEKGLWAWIKRNPWLSAAIGAVALGGLTWGGIALFGNKKSKSGGGGSVVDAVTNLTSDTPSVTTPSIATPSVDNSNTGGGLLGSLNDAGVNVTDVVNTNSGNNLMAGVAKSASLLDGDR